MSAALFCSLVDQYRASCRDALAAMASAPEGRAERLAAAHERLNVASAAVLECARAGVTLPLNEYLRLRAEFDQLQAKLADRMAAMAGD